MATVNTELLTNQPSLTPTGVSKVAPGITNGASKPAKNTAPTAPRIDLQPLYSSLKELVGDKWQRYMAIVAEFMLGGRNQAELTRELDPILQRDPAKEHAHNQLVCALAYNITRDAPEPGIASWVSANDKPTSTSKPVSGDAAEQRLKSEVMQLPPRDRHRIKSIQDDPYDPLAKSYQEAFSTTTIKPPDVVPTSAGGFSKTNWDVEIKKRYAQPLFTESSDFPDPDAIQARMQPICYELGIGGGASPLAGCAEYLNLACETYVKKVLADVIGAVWSNGPSNSNGESNNFIKTAAYKRRLEKEEAMWLREEGGIARNAAGLLPVEVEASEGRKAFDMGDFRLALRTADGLKHQNPLMAARVVEGWSGLPGADWYDDGEDEEKHESKGAVKVNGVVRPKPVVNGLTNGTGGDEMDIDSTGPDDWGWPGGGAGDREALGSLLDDCLAV